MTGKTSANGAEAPAMTTQQITTALQAETLTGDIRDMVLTEFKHQPKPWQQMNEEEQQRLIDRAEDIAGQLVQRAVNIIAERGLPSLPITVGKFTVDAGELKGVFEAYASDDNLLRIRHLAGQRAMFVLASPDAYEGEKAPAEPENVGDLAIPKTGKGAPSDPEALKKVGRGNGKKPPAADLPAADVSNPPFNATDDIPAGLKRNPDNSIPA